MPVMTINSSAGSFVVIVVVAAGSAHTPLTSSSNQARLPFIMFVMLGKTKAPAQAKVSILSTATSRPGRPVGVRLEPGRRVSRICVELASFRACQFAMPPV